MNLSLLIIGIFFSLTNGFEWKSLDDALADAKKDEKLVLFYMSKSNCKPCKKLNEQLIASTEFAELSEKFSLAQVVDDIPKDTKFKLDGKYVPKIVFLNFDGVVLEDLVNEDAKKAQYFYNKVEHVVKSMNKALEKAELDNGFGKAYIWYTWENGLKSAREQNKPILVVFHQDWCGACQRLKPKFAESEDIKKYASEFIMINTEAEELVKGDKYKADGEYYPKILFLDSYGDHIKQEWNHGTKHSHVLHYYGDGQELSKSMERVIANRTQIMGKENGYGKHLNWVKFDEAYKIAKEESKPIMVIIHKSYCGACKALKPKIRNDKEIAEISKNFVMVNCEDDDEPNEDQFDQDGAYIPRIFFLDNNGKVETSLFNPAKDYEKAKYAYGTAKSIHESMMKALEMKLGQREPIVEETTATSSDTIEPAVTEGFGNKIVWYQYADGLREAKKAHKIAMLVFYNDYCQFSAYLKQQFRESPEIHEESKKFVMIKVGEDETSALGDKFDVDGTYTPRIFFMDPDQNLQREINNTETQYKDTMYYYGTAEEILKGMKLAQEIIKLTLGRGFGEYINWVTYEKSFEIAKERNLPIMLIIHKSWCGACSALKPVIANSRPIWELSYHFVMVNVEDEEEPLDNQYFIDGGYYPRIYFMDSNGTVHHDQHNRDPKFLKYKFSYHTEEQVLHAMRFANAKFSSGSKLQSTTAGSTQTTSESSTQESSTSSSSTSNKVSHGKKYLEESGLKWQPIDNALKESKESGKPILFLIHRTTCPACKAVLKMISKSDEFKEKSSAFVLADIEDDVDEATADSYDVDGGYVPRIYFLDTDGNIIKDIWNKGTNYLENKFYYYEMNSVSRSMDKVLEHMNKGSEKTESETKLEDKKDEL